MKIKAFPKLHWFLMLGFLSACSTAMPQKMPLTSFNNDSIIHKNRYVFFNKNNISENISAKGKYISFDQNGNIVAKDQIISKDQISQVVEKQKIGSHWAWGILGGAIAGITQTAIEAANAGYCDGCPIGVQGVIYVPVYSLVGAGIGAFIPKYKETRIFKNE